MVIFLAIVAPAGARFAETLAFPGFAEARGVERAGLALLCGLACLPVALDLAGRFGPLAMAAAAVALALSGLPALARGLSAPLPAGLRFGLAAAALWIGVSTFVMISWPDGGGLTHSVFVLDYVKHSEATAAIAGSGTPPWNPTFHTPGVTAVYYYFFYSLTAVVALIGAPVGVEPRHAAYAAAAIAALTLYALADLLWRRSAADAALGLRQPQRPAAVWLIALLLATGLDIFPLARFALDGLDNLPHDPEVWNDQVTALTLTALWVPHHAAALASAFIALLALAGPEPKGWRQILLAALAFASTAGMSVYVAVGAGVTAALWLLTLLIQRRPRDAARLVAAGLVALALAAPWLRTLLATYGGGEAPIAFGIRSAGIFPFVIDNPVLRTAAQLATMVAAYMVEFGVFLIGAYAFWKKAGRAGLANDAARILVLGAAASFLVGSFLRSTVLYNDLGWRVMLFAQMATLVWTLSAARDGLFRDRSGPWAAAWFCLIAGYAPLVYSFVQARRFPEQNALARAVNADERAAWRWANANLPQGAVVQAQANVERAYNFGLYSRFPAYIADHHVGRLFGASEQAVLDRIGETLPLFDQPQTKRADVRAFVERRGVSAIVVTALDAVFAAPEAWTAQVRPAFSTPHARVYLSQDIADAKP